MYPHERSLVKRLEGKPFALLGVDTDESREVCKKAMEDNHLTWRSWFDGQGGPIVESWKIEAFPTLVLIDAQGHIRHKFEGVPKEKDLDKMIDDLVKEAEQGSASS
jgi:peroxiredoxin